MTADLVDISTGEITSTPLGICPVCKQSAFADLVQALGELQEPSKGGKAQVGNRGTYTYLTLPDLLTAVRAPLAAHHLAIMQEVTNTEHSVSVVTVLLHASGYAFRSPTLTLPAGPGAQAVGSATTYARRYTLAAMVGLAGAEDDDAQSVRPPQSSTPPTQPPVTPGGVDTRQRAASDSSRKLMWALLRKTVGADNARGYVANYLQIGEDWSTADLTQAQVSGVINALKAPPAQGSDTTPPPNWGDG